MKRLLAFAVLLTLTPSVLWAQASPDNSRVPPLTSLTAGDGAVFTFRNGDVYRNGVSVYGAGSEMKAKAGLIYVKGYDSEWYRFIGGNSSWPWLPFGPTDPCATGCAAVVVTPPVITPVTPGVPLKLEWQVNGATTTDVAGGSFKLYVNALAGVVLAGRTCIATKDSLGAANVTCTAPMPTLAQGQYDMTITWVDAKKAESPKSNMIKVLLSATLLVPSDLTAK